MEFRPAVRLALAVGGIALVGVVDWASGTEIRVYPLYFLPLTLGAWGSRRVLGAALAVVATAAWVVSNHAAGLDYRHTWAWPVNTTMQLAAFLTVGLLLAELRRRLERERALARVDELTGLDNVRAFRDRAALLLELSRRHLRPLVLAYLDLDDFKSVNDTRGHAEGDRALRTVAATLRGELRRTDLAARVGGDEFAIVLAEVAVDDARQVMARVHEAIHTAMADNGWSVGASIGAIAFYEPQVDLDAALHRVDALMYSVKRAGKRRIAFVEHRAERDEPSAVGAEGS